MNTCVKDHTKWRAKENEHGKGDNPHPKVHCKGQK